MDVNLEALVGELGLITPARAAAPDDADGPGPVAHGEFDALVAALILAPQTSAAPVPSVWPGIFGPHVLDTVQKAPPDGVVDIAPDPAMVFELDTAMVPELDTVMVPELDTVMVIEPDTVTFPEPVAAAVHPPETAVVPHPATAAVLPPETLTDIEPAPGVDAVLDAVRAVRADAHADMPALPEEDDKSSPRLDLSASADVLAAPPVAARPAMAAVTRESEPPVVDAPRREPREILSPKVESPKVEPPTGESPTSESREVKAPMAESQSGPTGPTGPTGSTGPSSLKVEAPAVNLFDVAATALPSGASKTPAADMISARQVVATAVSDRPAELPHAVVVKPVVRADVVVDAPDAGIPQAHGEPARPFSDPSARPAGAPAAVAAYRVAPERPIAPVGMRPMPFAAAVASYAGVSHDKTAAVPVTVVSAGVSGTPWHAAVAEAPVTGTPVAATPNILLRPTADDGQPLESRLVELVRWQAREGGGRVEMKLRPEFLGAMTVTVHVDGGVVKASLAAESQATRDFLQAEAGHLKSALEEQGFTLETFEVSDEPDPREQEQPHQRPRQQPGPRRSARSMSGGTSFGETFDVVM